MRLKAVVFTLAMVWQVQKSETGCSDWNQLFFLPDFWASTLSSFLPKFLSKLCWSYESQPTWLLRLHFQFSECFLKLKSTARFNLTSHVIMKSKFVNEKILNHSYFRWFSAIGGLSLATAVKLWSSQLLRLVWPVRLVTCNEFVETRSDLMLRERRAVCCIIASLIFERMSYNGMSGEDKTEPTAKLEIPKIS